MVCPKQPIAQRSEFQYRFWRLWRRLYVDNNYEYIDTKQVNDAKDYTQETKWKSTVRTFQGWNWVLINLTTKTDYQKKDLAFRCTMLLKRPKAIVSIVRRRMWRPSIAVFSSRNITPGIISGFRSCWIGPRPKEASESSYQDDLKWASLPLTRSRPGKNQWLPGRKSGSSIDLESLPLQAHGHLANSWWIQADTNILWSS